MTSNDQSGITKDVEMGKQTTGTGIGRGGFLFAFLGINLCTIFIEAFLVREAVAIAFIILILPLSIWITSLRCRNMGAPKAWLGIILLFALPIGLFMCLALPPGYYLSKKLDTAGKTVTWICILAVAGLILWLVASSIGYSPRTPSPAPPAIRGESPTVPSTPLHTQNPIIYPTATPTPATTPTPAPTPAPYRYTKPTPTPPPSRRTIELPSRVYMEIRHAPKLSSRVVKTFSPGTYSVLPTDSHTDSDGINWLQIRINGYTGWVTENGLMSLER